MNEEWVKVLRQDFPIAQSTTFFDIAYENCGSLFLREAYDRYLKDKAEFTPDMVKAGGNGKGNTIEIVNETRDLIAKFLHVPNVKNIAFTKNTNEGINIILQGFDFKEGDSIVTCDIEHPSVLMPCLNVANRGVKCKVAVSPDCASVTPELLLSCADATTKMIVISYVQSSSGYKTDIKKLADECHKRNIFLVVDVIQALGFIDVDVDKLGIDAVSASCYKGLLSTEGVGFLYCNDELLKYTKTIFAASNSVLTIDRTSWKIVCNDELDARKFENSTLNFAAIYSLNIAIKRINEIGISSIEKHISACFEVLYKGFSDLGFKIQTPFNIENRCHSLAIADDNIKLAEYFLNNRVYISGGKGNFIRISIAPFTTEEDIARILELAKRWKHKNE